MIWGEFDGNLVSDSLSFFPPPGQICVKTNYRKKGNEEGQDENNTKCLFSLLRIGKGTKSFLFVIRKIQEKGNNKEAAVICGPFCVEGVFVLLEREFV